ncbi:hypothetical protein SAMN04487948_11324 [Halogranum amylolyticum]|uniref:Uncharacterized protein n=1 Tax=Halogranum amylolyticum TaxID=660520 RepID=A0A1H8UX58_9EURY|nr:hypothetical protein [Halogranum amylolyticum]SEP07810.1 hypothetical protein SAMN04487948_11324 [Halogranum amylolyticum]
MSLLLDLLKSVFLGAIDLFVIDAGGDRKSVRRQLRIARLVVGVLVAIAALVVWTVTSPLRWGAAAIGMLAVAYGLYAEVRYR